MNEPSTVGAPPRRGRESGGLSNAWPMLAVSGIVLMVVGAAAIGSAFVATLTTMAVFGILLLVGAVVQVVAAIGGRSWRGFFLHLMAGVLYLVAGLFLVEHPLEAAAGLTLLVAASLLVGGILRVVLSLLDRFDGWGWTLLSGVVSILLGTAIWRQWPLSGLWVIGLFVGIEMLFSGLSWVMLALMLRSASKTEVSP
jgi:uncharacterized membrane protein HdeD (DUF308 family)